MVKTKVDMQNFMISSSTTPNDYVEALWSKALCLNQVYTKYMLNDIFVDRLPDSMRNNTWSYWTCNNPPTLHDLMRPPTSLRTLQGETPHHHIGNSKVRLNSREDRRLDSGRSQVINVTNSPSSARSSSLSSHDCVITYHTLKWTGTSMLNNLLMSVIHESISQPRLLSVAPLFQNNHHLFRRCCPGQVFPITHIATNHLVHYDFIYWPVLSL